MSDLVRELGVISLLAFAFALLLVGKVLGFGLCVVDVLERHLGDGIARLRLLLSDRGRLHALVVVDGFVDLHVALRQSTGRRRRRHHRVVVVFLVVVVLLSSSSIR